MRLSSGDRSLSVGSVKGLLIPNLDHPGSLSGMLTVRTVPSIVVPIAEMVKY